MTANMITAKTRSALAMVAVLSQTLPDAARVIAACTIPKELGGEPARQEGPKVEWVNDALVFDHGGALATVAFMSVAIPWEELREPCAAAWWWPEAEETMRSHRYHFIVALTGGNFDPIEQRLIVTRLINAVIAETDATGVYWGDGKLVHAADEFARLSEGATSDRCRYCCG